MTFDDSFYEIKAEAGAGFAPGFARSGVYHGLEELRLGIGRNPVSVIGDAELDMLIGGADGDLDQSAGGGVFDGVADQITGGFAEQRGVAVAMKRMGRHTQRQGMVFEGSIGAQTVSGFLKDRNKFDGIKRGQVEEMLDRERPDLLDIITTPATSALLRVWASPWNGSSKRKERSWAS